MASSGRIFLWSSLPLSEFGGGGGRLAGHARKGVVLLVALCAFVWLTAPRRGRLALWGPPDLGARTAGGVFSRWLAVRECVTGFFICCCCCCLVFGFGCLAVWLFGCLAVWLFGCLAVWLLAVGCLVLAFVSPRETVVKSVPPVAAVHRRQPVGGDLSTRREIRLAAVWLFGCCDALCVAAVCIRAALCGAGCWLLVLAS